MDARIETMRVMAVIYNRTPRECADWNQAAGYVAAFIDNRTSRRCADWNKHACLSQSKSQNIALHVSARIETKQKFACLSFMISQAAFILRFSEFLFRLCYTELT